MGRQQKGLPLVGIYTLLSKILYSYSDKLVVFIEEHGHGHPSKRWKMENIEAIPHAIDENPETSIWIMAQQKKLSYDTGQVILKKILRYHAAIFS